MPRHIQRDRWSTRRLRGIALPFSTARRALLLAAIALVAIPSSAAAAQTSPPGEIGFGGFAYGTQAVVANILRSGPSAAVGLGGGCLTKVGVTNKNATVAVNVPKILHSGTVHTLAASENTSTGVAATTSASTQGIDLLNGLIRASAITAASTTNRDSTTGAFSLSSAGTSLVGLVINGQKIQGTPAPNTKIDLPGIGYVVLNQQTGSVGTETAGLTVTAIHVVVTVGSNHAPAGTQLNVSVASSSLVGPAPGLLTGGAFGTAANVANTIISGPSFPVGLPCLGTGGATVSNGAAGINLPHVLTSGTITNTANGTVNSTHVSGATSSTVENLNLANGLVTATAVKAAVSADGQPPTLGDTSSFLGLKVAGHPLINDNVPPNTEIGVKGIGQLWLHRQIKTGNSITVVMVQLVIKTPNNPLHLRLGAIVDVGYASVGVN